MKSTVVAAMVVVASLPLLAGCSHLHDRLIGTQTAAADLPGQVEPIHAAVVANDLAVFWVSSNGCTRKEDLIPIVTIQGGDAIITLRRLDEDKCRDPEIDGVEVKWSFEELGLAPGQAVSVNNPYQLPQT